MEVGEGQNSAKGKGLLGKLKSIDWKKARRELGAAFKPYPEKIPAEEINEQKIAFTIGRYLSRNENPFTIREVLTNMGYFGDDLLEKYPEVVDLTSDALLNLHRLDALEERAYNGKFWYTIPNPELLTRIAESGLSQEQKKALEKFSPSPEPDR